METDNYKQDIWNQRINNEREHYWRIIFKDNNGEVDDEKYLMHAKRWNVYMNQKLNYLRVDIMWMCKVLTEEDYLGSGR